MHEGYLRFRQGLGLWEALRKCPDWERELTSMAGYSALERSSIVVDVYADSRCN